jgi:glycogen debranching enzyme
MFGADFAGAAGLAFPVVLSTGARSTEFRPRAYWRGPTWPVINWLLWCGLRAHGLDAEAARLREANLALLARPGASFAEYYEPFTAEPLGSVNQSWTAAVALDWLAHPD